MLTEKMRNYDVAVSVYCGLLKYFEHCEIISHTFLDEDDRLYRIEMKSLFY